MVRRKYRRKSKFGMTQKAKILLGMGIGVVVLSIALGLGLGLGLKKSEEGGAVGGGSGMGGGSGGGGSGMGGGGGSGMGGGGGSGMGGGGGSGGGEQVDPRIAKALADARKAREDRAFAAVNASLEAADPYYAAQQQAIRAADSSADAYTAMITEQNNRAQASGIAYHETAAQEAAREEEEADQKAAREATFPLVNSRAYDVCEKYLSPLKPHGGPPFSQFNPDEDGLPEGVKNYFVDRILADPTGGERDDMSDPALSENGEPVGGWCYSSPPWWSESDTVPAEDGFSKAEADEIFDSYRQRKDCSGRWEVDGESNRALVPWDPWLLPDELLGNPPGVTQDKAMICIRAGIELRDGRIQKGEFSAVPNLWEQTYAQANDQVPTRWKDPDYVNAIAASPECVAYNDRIAKRKEHEAARPGTGCCTRAQEIAIGADIAEKYKNLCAGYDYGSQPWQDCQYHAMVPGMIAVPLRCNWPENAVEAVADQLKPAAPDHPYWGPGAG